MKILIFGATGFVGKNLQNYLKQRGHQVISASRTGGTANIQVDVTNKGAFSTIDSVPDVIVNCASVVPAKGRHSNDPFFLEDLFQTNVIGGANIANWAVEKEVGKLINCSTLVVVKKPWPTPLTEEDCQLPQGNHVGYSMSKLSQEQIMLECTNNSNTDVVHLRLSAVYGAEMEHQGIIFDLLGSARDNKDIYLNNAEKNFIDLIHVIDVCRGIELVAQSEMQSLPKKINLASGNEISILELAEIIKEKTFSSSKIFNKIDSSEVSRADIDISKFLALTSSDFEFLSIEKGIDDLLTNTKSRDIPA